MIRVYTRVGCGLCARAERAVAREAGGGLLGGPRADVEVVDVDTDDELQRRYGVRVPVVVIDGVEVAELEVSREQVRRALRAARRARR